MLSSPQNPIKFLLSLSLVLTIALLISCGSSGSDLSNASMITSFSIGGTAGTINQSNRSITLDLMEPDLSALTPEIGISTNATVSPASGVAQDFTSPVTYTVTAEDGSTTAYTVTVTSSIIGLSINGNDYELVTEARTWAGAASFAVSRGGALARIDNEAEQNAIFNALNGVNIDMSSTIAPDGGGASYLWIGGNDLATEGNWIWDGNNDQTGDQFWMGKQDGSPVGGLYNNWGNEPDDFGSGQDALGFALTNWPLGSAGQWNDVSDDNELFFLIELD